MSPSFISPSSPLLLGCNCRWLRYAGLIFKHITVYHPHIHHPYLIFVTMMMMIINVTIIIIDYINLILSGKQGWDLRMSIIKSISSQSVTHLTISHQRLPNPLNCPFHISYPTKLPISCQSRDLMALVEKSIVRPRNYILKVLYGESWVQWKTMNY